QAPPVGLGEQVVDVGEGAEQRVDRPVVGDVVAAVGHRRGVERAQPDRVDPQLDQVVEPGGHARQVAHAVAVGVGEAPGIDLVDHGLTRPRPRHAHTVTSGDPTSPRAAGARPPSGRRVTRLRPAPCRPRAQRVGSLRDGTTRTADDPVRRAVWQATVVDTGLEILRLVLRYAHLVGFALLLGGAVVQYLSGRIRVNRTML